MGPYIKSMGTAGGGGGQNVSKCSSHHSIDICTTREHSFSYMGQKV